MAPVDDTMLALQPATAERAVLEQIADRTREYVATTRTRSTVRAYAADWREFLGFCAARHLASLPASAEVSPCTSHTWPAIGASRLLAVRRSFPHRRDEFVYVKALSHHANAVGDPAIM